MSKLLYYLGNYIKVKKLSVIALLIISVVTISYFVQKGNYSLRKSRAFNIQTGTIPSQQVLLEEHFDSAASLSGWKLIQNGTTNKISITTSSYKGSGSLLFNYNDYSNGQYLRADKVISSTPITNLVVRSAFYDDMSPTKGSTFGVVNQNNQNSSILVNNSISKSNYLFRINTYGETYDTGIPRTLGWHIFEVVVTDKGTYGKIDNNFIYKADRTLMVNTSLTQCDMISYVSTWGLYGKTMFDEVTVAKMDNISSIDQIFRIQQIFYNTYKNTDFSPIYGDLGNRTHSNDLRALLNTSVSFYAYGKRVNDLAAISRSKTLFSNALSNGHWNDENDGKFWARGAYLAQLSGALNLMKADLDTSTINTAKDVLSRLVQTYILANDNFDNALSGWQNLSTPISTNTAIVTSGKGRNNTPGLVINYTDGTVTSAGHNLVNIRKTLPVFASAPSLKATIWFYDDMSSQKAVVFGLNYSKDSNNTGIVVSTAVSKDFYLFRINTPGNMKPTIVRRSLGWHKFTLTLSSNCCGINSEKIGVMGYIDGQKVGVNPLQLNADAVSLVSTWGLTGTNIFDDLLVTRMPDTGKTGDTKGEENGWHALVLAEAANFFPEIPNSNILSDLAKCYAYHSITVTNDPEYCETKTITAYDDFRFDNHGILNPSYQSAVMSQLIRAIYSFSLVGKQVPVEFTHNLTPSFNKFASYIDTKAFQFINSPMGDWTGVTNTPYQSGEPVILYFAKNSTLPFSLSEYLNKRSISFYNLVGNYIKDYPTSIPTFDQSNRSNSGYIWWSDSIISAEMLLLGGYPSL